MDDDKRGIEQQHALRDDGILMRNCSLLLLVLSFLLFVGNGWGATYYVDQGGGNDANPGTSTGNAWKTISKVNRSSFSAGDSILFKRGETWHEQFVVPSSGSAGNPITFGAYGNGVQPVLSGAITLPSGSWTANDPVAGVWSYPTLYWRYMFWEDNVYLQIASSANCSDGNWYYDGSKIYYKPTSGTLTDHKVETNLYYTDLGNNSYITFDGIAFEKGIVGLTQAPPGGTTRAGSNITVKNSTFTCFGVALWLIADNTVPSNIIVTNNTFDYNNKSIYVTLKYTGHGPNNVTIDNNIVSHCSQGYGAGSGDHEGIGAQALNNSNISNNTITGNCRGIYIYTPENESTHDVNIYKNYIKTTRYGVSTNGNYNTNVYNNKIYYNVVLSTGADEEGWNNRYGIVLGSTEHSTGSINKLYNNVVHGGIGNLILWGKSAETNFYYEIKNNIFSSPSDGHMVEAKASGSLTAGNVTFDYNLYYPAANNSFYAGGTTYSYANWKAIDGTRDVHSVTGDPKFSNVGSNNYALLAGSPAIDAGTNVGLTTDYFGNPVPKGSGPDIGVYEFQGTGIIRIPTSPSHLLIY